MAEGAYVTERMLRWRRRTDGPLMVIAIGSLPLLLLLELERSKLTAADRALLDVVNVVVLTAFAIDYFVELALTDNRRAYIKGEWISAIIVIGSGLAIIPSLAALGGTRIIRGVPALRALTGTVRLIAIGGAAARDGRRLLRRRAVTFVLALAGVTWLTAAAAFTLAEDVGVDRRVESFTDALWWAAATLTTVGYGDVVPVTFGGRVAGVVAMLVGISTFAVITARVAAFLVTPDDEPEASRTT